MKVLFRSIIFIVPLLVLVVLFRAMLHNPSEELLPNKVDTVSYTHLTLPTSDLI